MARKNAKSAKPQQKKATKTSKSAAAPVIDPHELADWMKGTLPKATAQHNKTGVMFMIGGKVVAFTRPGGIAMKLPEARIAELIESRDASFLVMGTKTMREWVLMQYASPGDYLKDGKLFEEAMRFVASVEK
jgi:hypothetical protein